jgi:hypothetical protein
MILAFTGSLSLIAYGNSRFGNSNKFVKWYYTKKLRKASIQY